MTKLFPRFFPFGFFNCKHGCRRLFCSKNTDFTRVPGQSPGHSLDNPGCPNNLSARKHGLKPLFCQNKKWKILEKYSKNVGENLKYLVNISKHIKTILEKCLEIFGKFFPNQSKLKLIVKHGL